MKSSGKYSNGEQNDVKQAWGHTKDSADVNELFTKYYLAGRLWLVDALFASVVLYPETKDKKTKVEATSFSLSLFPEYHSLKISLLQKKKKNLLYNFIYLFTFSFSFLVALFT